MLLKKEVKRKNNQPKKYNKMKKFLTMFDDNNSINEKAIIGFAAFIVMIIFAVVDIITGILNKPLLINDFIFDSFKMLTIACFGIASVDKWINRKHSNPEENEGESESTN
jgi:hypothetical protein